MSESLFSQSWYRVAPLKPRLRSHVHIFKHCYRGNDWYVIQDRFTGRHHRFSPEAYQLIGLMDGRRSLNVIWEQACINLGDHMPTQDEVIVLLSQLFRSDLLQTSALPNFDDLEKRQSQGKRKKLLTSIKSPMFLRFPLFDPDKFLSATIHLVRPLLGWPAMIIWLFTVTLATLLAIMHWPDLTNNFTDQVLGLENLVLITLIYPVLKIIHEFGHAYMVKKWGGEVHEMGVLLLVFMPIPYLEASASLAFRDKYKRMGVGAAGILIEVFIASLSLLIWLSIEPGAIRAAAFNIMLIAGVSTILFNGNPLLRFDAYYVLADFLEIPNLGQNANRYVSYLCQRYLLGVRRVEPKTNSMTEGLWLASYGITSFFYRIFISFRIILFVAGKFFFIGLLLAIWAGIGMLVMPLVKLIKYLVKNPSMKRKRVRLTFVVLLPFVLLLATLFFWPLPSYTICEGVTWAPEESRIHAEINGFVQEIYQPNGNIVEPGTPLLRFVDPQLDVQVRILTARLEEYKARYDVSLQIDRTDAILLKEALAQIEAELSRAKEKQNSLILLSKSKGTVVLMQGENLQGKYFQRGTPIGYVLDPEKINLRVVVDQADIERVRGETLGVEARLTHNIDTVIPATIIREIPAASRELPSMALSLEGGGKYGLDPREPRRPLTMEHLFQFEVKMQEGATINIEERVYVRFRHQSEPLAWGWIRALRRLLLSRFSY